MRYLLLVLLNLPVILLALTNVITLYKMNRISKRRFRWQVSFWIIVLIGLLSSFPVYNYLTGKPIFDSSSFSAFDIIQTTVIILLVYIANNQRQKIERVEKTLRDLHQEVSIKFSQNKNGKS